MIVSAQLAEQPLCLLPNPFRLDAFATALISAASVHAQRSCRRSGRLHRKVRSALPNAVTAAQHPPQPTGVQPGRTTRPDSTTRKNSNRRYRQVSAGHSEQIGIKVRPIDYLRIVYENGSAPMQLANTAVEDPVVIPAPVVGRSRNRRARPTLARRNPTVSLLDPTSHSHISAPGCTLGIGVVVHYGVTMGEGAVLAADSFLMKGEEVPAHAHCCGNPAYEQPLGERSV